MGNDAVHDLTAAYALDALEPDEARGYEEHLAGCEHCRDELASLQAAASSLAYAAPPAVPPPALRGRILDAARAERPDVVPLRPRAWSRPLAAVAAVAACAAAGLAVWDVSLHDRLGRPPQALRGVPLSGAKGSVVVAGGRAALVFSDLPPAPTGKTYEAWVLVGGRASRAATFAGGHAIVVSLDRSVPSGAVVAVTVERAGGVDQPTQTPKIRSAPV
jgi:anti-sigma-K factor RskA